MQIIEFLKSINLKRCNMNNSLVYSIITGIIFMSACSQGAKEYNSRFNDGDMIRIEKSVLKDKIIGGLGRTSHRLHLRRAYRVPLERNHDRRSRVHTMG